MVPGARRASARTKARARPTASLASPSQSEVHSTCEVGSIVWLAMSANGTGRICSTVAGGLQREPQASRPAHAERVPAAGPGEEGVGLAHEHQHLVARGRVGIATCGQQDVVRLLAIRDDRRLLLIRSGPVALDRAHTAAKVAADANL